MFKFIIASVIVLVQTPIILLSATPIESKLQSLKHALFSIPIIIGTYMSFTGDVVLGVVLILGSMVLGALIVRGNGEL